MDMSFLLNVVSIRPKPTRLVLFFFCIPVPAISPGQCETDTKPFQGLKEPKEMRGKPAKVETELFIAHRVGGASDHEGIIGVFLCDKHENVKIKLSVENTDKND